MKLISDENQILFLKDELANDACPVESIEVNYGRWPIIIKIGLIDEKNPSTVLVESGPDDSKRLRPTSPRRLEFNDLENFYLALQILGFEISTDLKDLLDIANSEAAKYKPTSPSPGR